MKHEIKSTGIPHTVFVLSDAVGSIGGAARATLLLCQALADSGARVTVFTTASPDASTRAALAAKNIQVKTPLIGRGSRFGLPAQSLALRVWLAMRRSKEAVLHSVGLHAELSHFLALPGRFATFVWETTEALPNNKFVNEGVVRRLNKVNTLLSPSLTVAANAKATYRFTGRTAILPFWTEDRAGGVTHEAARAPRRFLFIGRMDVDKGFRFLIPAFERVRSEFHNVGLDVCGSGDPSTIPELTDPPDGVTARGNVSDEELMAKLSRCFAVVLPSLHEGYPLSLLEACAFGKPVIASSVGSIPEVFAGRDCAILVPPGDTNALADAMTTLLTEDEMRYQQRCDDARRVFEAVSSETAIRADLATAYGTP